MNETLKELLPSADELPAFTGEQGGNVVASLFGRLLAGHREQWEQENLSRTCTDTSPDKLGSIKQHIDELNDRRVATIQNIDDLVDRVLTSPDTTAPLALTIGQALDRLAIAHVRHEKVADDLSLVALAEQATAWDADRNDVLLCRRRPPRGVTRKHYAAAGMASPGSRR